MIFSCVLGYTRGLLIPCLRLMRSRPRGGECQWERRPTTTNPGLPISDLGLPFVG